HVDPGEIVNTGLGSSDQELEEGQTPPPAAKFVSRGLLRGQEGRVLALRSTTSAVAVAAAQADPASPGDSLQASLQQEVTAAFPRPEKARMEAAMAELAAVQQGVMEAIAASPAKAKKEATVAELARQLSDQLDARAKARIAEHNLGLDRAAEA